jgi:deoxyhypusine synthase
LFSSGFLIISPHHTMTTDSASNSGKQAQQAQQAQQDHGVSAPPASATEAVLVPSAPVPEGTRLVRGIDFNQFAGRNITVAEILSQMASMGFQATAVAEAVRIINDMV